MREALGERNAARPVPPPGERSGWGAGARAPAGGRLARAGALGRVDGKGG